MDVPELDDALVDKIAGQSDAQAGALSIRELERIRDDNLVAIMQALAAQQGGKGWGAGALLREHEARLRDAERGRALDTGPSRCGSPKGGCRPSGSTTTAT